MTKTHFPTIFSQLKSIPRTLTTIKNHQNYNFFKSSEPRTATVSAASIRLRETTRVGVQLGDASIRERLRLLAGDQPLDGHGLPKSRWRHGGKLGAVQTLGSDGCVV